jgi:hypothetical protein
MSEPTKKFYSGRGGKRVGAGRPKSDVVESKRVRVPYDVDISLMHDCYKALIDARDNRSTARTHDALNKLLDDVFGVL